MKSNWIYYGLVLLTVEKIVRHIVVTLLIALAIFDLLGEFAAQGRFAISMTVPFLAATVLLILCLLYRREVRREEKDSVRM